MSLPASFVRDGFKSATQARSRMRLPNGRYLKPLMIGTEGETNTGKTEFIFSCPGPGVLFALDRNYDGVLDNPTPPAERHEFAVEAIKIKLNTTGTQTDYAECYRDIRTRVYKALDNPDAVTIGIDCDSDLWEIQRLADFGKLANVWPMTRYGDTYAAKRAFIARCWDSGKIIVGANKVRDRFETVYKPDGTPEMEQDGKTERRRKSGEKERQGFPDTDYLWQIQLRNLYQPPTYDAAFKRTWPGKWGIRILKCKPVPDLIGTELWGSDANFRGLVSLVYPNVDPGEWGL